MNPAHVTPALGAHLHELKGQSGVQFAVWAPQAEGLEVCLFDTATGPETRRIALAPEGNGVWQAFVPGLTAGQLYGLRASGPWVPVAGQRFNPARLLLDPWALALVGSTGQLALQAGHAVADPLHPSQPWAQHQPNPLDNAAAMPKCVVLDAQAELDAGHKRSHWMWFVFPQLAALGRSPAAHALSLRLAAARRLITDTRHPLAEIALRTGFSSACFNV